MLIIVLVFVTVSQCRSTQSQAPLAEALAISSVIGETKVISVIGNGAMTEIIWDPVYEISNTGDRPILIDDIDISYPGRNLEGGFTWLVKIGNSRGVEVYADRNELSRLRDSGPTLKQQRLPLEVPPGKSIVARFQQSLQLEVNRRIVPLAPGAQAARPAGRGGSPG